MELTTPKAADYSQLDHMTHAIQGRYTLGLSPASLMLAYLDWWVHLATSPGKQVELIEKANRKAARLTGYAAQAYDSKTPPCIEPLPQDNRFSAPEWQNWPFNLIYQSFLLTQQWYHNATTGVPGVSKHHEDVISFMTRQYLDMFSPSNYLMTNPEVLNTTFKQSGMNLLQGYKNYLEDWQRTALREKPVGTEQYEVGKNVAITPGKVIYRNRLIELIQYSPATDVVQAEPVLIVSAWIMKYYILDLSPENSLVKYLVDHGHTVFMVSWKNPGPEDRELGMDDYRTSGIMAALDVISAVIPGRKIHAVGYCLGGTLLTIAASAMARDGDDRLQSITLFATQTDFTDAGELLLFIDESQVDYLEDIMWQQGYLDTSQMAGAFQILRSNDLIWSRIIQEYLQGDREKMNDLMAWNADGTRLPYRMHSEYLRTLFLHNDLFEGRYMVGDKPIVMSDIRAPMFVVSTVKDHVAPWKSVYKIMLPVDTEVTFVLTSGGHNAGIVSEPGHPHRSFQASTRSITDKYVDPEHWQATTPVQEGSWWTLWHSWLTERSGGLVKPPQTGAPGKGYLPIEDAPGTYVLQP
ncbi:MAG TPA: alpha/beta fold hydrolase [Chloroflexia bacterium]|nr:alpha/beta fold hydrolase [Chloroflexia bacterium]